ncbi:MAG: hypothetical protein E7616_06850 [Ruminococcaceae bacterium]|nr:hypothetical protein [Oscillospiraceae bacterium]
MESSGLDLGKILKMVTENPAMLQTALSFAGKLKDNMGGAENTPKDSATSNISPPASASPSLPVIGKQDSDNRAREDERRLLMALRPYLNETRREKIDFVLKILQLLELAGNLGLSFDIKPKGG